LARDAPLLAGRISVCRSLVVGTQLGWSPFPIQQQMDVIDSHAYWQHPHFPGRSWDMDNWTVKNIPMAGAADGGTLPSLALQRVEGKPYICTEYNHSAPNSTLARRFRSFARTQRFRTGTDLRLRLQPPGRRLGQAVLPSFFDIDQHPVKLASLPAQ
jgi:hypothetical protein